MKRLKDVTLKEAYEQAKQNSFAFWKTSGNYMNLDVPADKGNVQTRVFMGESIFILALVVENEGLESMASRADFIDIWPSVKVKYPQLFEDGVTGDLYVIP